MEGGSANDEKREGRGMSKSQRERAEGNDDEREELTAEG